MELMLRMNLRDDADPGKVAALISLAKELDAGSVIADAVNAGSAAIDFYEEVLRHGFEPQDADAAVAGQEARNQQEIIDEYRAEGGLDPDDAAPQPPSGAAVPPGVDKPEASKRGRRGSRTAEQQAAALAQPQPASPAAAQTQPPTGFAVPPGVSVGQQPQRIEPQAAMPKTQPAPSADGVMNLEDFKAEALSLFQAAQQAGRMDTAAPFNLIRRSTWPDGSPKDYTTVMIEKVPPERRRELLDWCVWALSQP